MSPCAHIAALHYYPLKSARGIELERAQLTIAGFQDDRRWMLVSETGRFLTQRELPRLALLELESISGERAQARQYFAQPGEAEWGC